MDLAVGPVDSLLAQCGFENREAAIKDMPDWLTRLLSRFHLESSGLAGDKSSLTKSFANVLMAHEASLAPTGMPTVSSVCLVLSGNLNGGLGSLELVLLARVDLGKSDGGLDTLRSG